MAAPRLFISSSQLDLGHNFVERRGYETLLRFFDQANPLKNLDILVDVLVIPVQLFCERPDRRRPLLMEHSSAIRVSSSFFMFVVVL